MVYSFGNRSKTNLETCHPDLQKIAWEALKHTMVDFGIHEGHRSIEDQKKAFDAGHSTLDGYNKKSKHNEYPSMAFDFHAYVPGHPELTWDEAHIVHIATVIIETARQLREKGLISHYVRWGGNWDNDGIIRVDHTLYDPVHIELIK